MGGNLGESGGGGKVCVTGWRNTCVMGGKGLILLVDGGGGKGLLRGLGVLQQAKHLTGAYYQS